MNVCFTSDRLFADGLMRQPVPESDPANIAYALGGTYFSFHSLRRLSSDQLTQKLRPFDLVFVALDIPNLMLVHRIMGACAGRAATYSEGHIADYQTLSPLAQVTFLEVLAQARFNFLYWERYISFYRALTSRPICYLPYPYLLDSAREYYIPNSQRRRTLAVPGGLAGGTRNGLASLMVAKQLLQRGVIDDMVCWPDAETFDEDAQAIRCVVLNEPVKKAASKRTLNWRRWLSRSGLDYRILLRMKRRLQSRPPIAMTRLPGREPLIISRRRGWLSYLLELAPARIMVDLNNRETVGRNALDCAALGIACVSTNRSDLQGRLFPQTTLHDSWDLDGAFTLCQRLTEDEGFYQAVTSEAVRNVEEYDHTQFQDRFQSLVAQHTLSVSTETV